MSIWLALLALAMTGEDAIPKDPAPPALQFEAVRVQGEPPATGAMISYEVRLVSTGDLDWRGKFDPRLKPVGRQGGSAVWEADAATLTAFLQYCQQKPTCNVVQAPKLVTPAGGEVRLKNGRDVRFVHHVERVSDGPPDWATRVAFTPHVETVFDGLRGSFSSGRVEAGGLRSRLKINRDRVVSIETSTYSETIAPAVKVERPKSSSVLLAAMERVGQAQPASISATIQIPVVESSSIEGEWVIPKDGTLIVSLGASSARKRTAFAREVRPEELLLIRYAPIPDTTAATPAAPAQISATPAAGRRLVPRAN